MESKISAAIFTCSILLAAALPIHLFAGPTAVTAAQVNGTWTNKSSSFKIWALGKQRLRIEFFGTYSQHGPSGPMAKIGEGTGIAFIEGDTATFRPTGTKKECMILLRFAGDQLIVTERGFCGFGLNVSADGTYQKSNSSKPKFTSK